MGGATGQSLTMQAPPCTAQPDVAMSRLTFVAANVKNSQGWQLMCFMFAASPAVCHSCWPSINRHWSAVIGVPINTHTQFKAQVLDMFDLINIKYAAQELSHHC